MAADQSDLSNEVDVLKWHLDDCATEIERLRGLGVGGLEIGVKVGEGGRLPVRTHATDAGLDLYVSEGCGIDPGEFVDVPCGIAVEFPVGWWGLITGRSSTLRRRGLLVAQGVIDEGYRGELFSGVWNMGESWQRVEAGERLAQLILFPTAPKLEVKRADSLGSSDRGSSGFGSSGA